MDLEGLTQDLRDLGEAGFRQKHSSPVLVFDGDRDADDAASFHTAFAKRDPSRPLSAPPPPARAPHRPEVFTVLKRPGGPFEDRIGLGRARNADVHLPLARLSKYHAYVTTSADGAAYLIADAGSKNGTYVDGVRLPTREPVPLRDGCEIQLGPYVFQFYTSRGLVDLVARRAR